MQLGETYPACVAVYGNVKIYSYNAKYWIRDEGNQTLKEVVPKIGTGAAAFVLSGYKAVTPANIFKPTTAVSAWGACPAAVTAIDAADDFLPAWWPLGIGGTIAVGLAALLLLRK